jgi:outer membrane receptor for ferrienterochelin and colicins
LSAFQETLWDKGEAVNTPVAIYALDRYFYTNRYSAGIFNDFKIGKSFDVQLTNSFSVYERIKNTYRLDLVSMEDVMVPSDDAQDTSNFYLLLNRAIITSKWKKPINMQFGYDLNTEFAKGQRIQGENQNIGDYAVFASGMYNVLRFQLNVGARYAYNTRYDAPMVFNVNGRYNFNSQWSVKASYAQGFRAPSLKELNLFFSIIYENRNFNSYSEETF